MSTKLKKKQVKKAEPSNQLAVDYHFPTPIYSIMRPEYLEAARAACLDGISEISKLNPEVNEIYPVIQTGDLSNDPRIADLCNFILNVSWDILNSQGYDMKNLRTFFREFWCQDHQKLSSMDQHVHGYGAQIVGFYFIDVPEGSPKVVFHDPKPGKVQINLPETNQSIATAASCLINYEPKPGMLMLTNAWLAHSFTRSASTKNVRFIHFTVVPRDVMPATCPTAAEVI